MRYEPDIISKKIEKKHKIKKLFILILYILLIPTIIFSLFLIILELGNSHEVPSFLNIDVYTISSESMRPKLKVNDIIIVKKGYPSNKYKIGNIVEEVSRKKAVSYGSTKAKQIALIDYGAKDNIVNSLLKRGVGVTIYPANTKSEMILATRPDGIMLSNGPGDPEDCKFQIEVIKKLYKTNIPILGICLGHQLMAIANGARTEKLKYGHRGANHPVKDLATDKVYITSQNHGYYVVDTSINPEIAEVSHINLNDGTVEGIRYKNKNIFTVQFHPEACPGPEDTAYIFDEFIDMVNDKN